jgi:cell division septum initiation protein DivIVA
MKDYHSLMEEIIRLREENASLRSRLASQASQPADPGTADFQKFKEEKASQSAMMRDPEYGAYLQRKNWQPPTQAERKKQLEDFQARRAAPGYAQPSSGPAHT